jgi:hypothetical protein
MLIMPIYGDGELEAMGVLGPEPAVAPTGPAAENPHSKSLTVVTHMSGKLRVAVSEFFAVVAVGLLCVLGCSHDDELKETERRGETIVVALKQYHADHSHYPFFLDDLCPQYLDEILPPTWGLETWNYTSTGKDFSLGFDESPNTGDGDSLWFRYLGEENGWQTGD